MKKTFAIESKHNPFILMLYISFRIRTQCVSLFAFRTYICISRKPVDLRFYVSMSRLTIFELYRGS